MRHAVLPRQRPQRFARRYPCGHRRADRAWQSSLGVAGESSRGAVRLRLPAHKTVQMMAGVVTYPSRCPCLPSGEVLAVEGRSAPQIFGSPDDRKLRSCATLLASVSPEGSVFHRLLDAYFQGRPDARTLRLLDAAPASK